MSKPLGSPVRLNLTAEDLPIGAEPVHWGAQALESSWYEAGGAPAQARWGDGWEDV